MSAFLLDTVWTDRLASFERLVVGFSGGLDSTVLLHVLLNYPLLSKKLFALHIHHGLSPYADDWAHHCREFCNAYSIPIQIAYVTIAAKGSLEESARKARYDLFLETLSHRDALLLAHHASDQAETVFFRLLRGSGVLGLGGMKTFVSMKHMTIFRPFLMISRNDFLAYAVAHRLSWVEDESNHHCHYSRNFLRHRVFPFLKTHTPTLEKKLVKTAQYCQEAALLLQDLAEIDGLNQVKKSPLPLALIKNLSLPRQKNFLRAWIHTYGEKMPEASGLSRIFSEVINARQDKTPVLHFATYVIKRYQETLYLRPMTQHFETHPMVWHHYPNPLIVGPWVIKAHATPAGFSLPPNAKLLLRFRQGGETFYYKKQTKSLKKLFQTWKVPPWERACLPLLYVDEVLAVVPGYAISDHFYAGEGAHSTFSFSVTTALVE